MSKEASCIVLDVGRSMAEMGSDGMSNLEKAKTAIRIIIQQKLLFTKRDELGLVLMGTKESQNMLYDETEGACYFNITEKRQIALPDLKMLEEVDVVETEDAEGDVLDALLVAMGMIHTKVGKYKWSRTIFIITDASKKCQCDEAQLETIAEALKRDQYRLYIIGINFSDGDDEEENNSDEVMDEEKNVSDMDERNEERHKGKKIRTLESEAPSSSSSSSSASLSLPQSENKSESLLTPSLSFGNANASLSSTHAGFQRTQDQIENEAFLRKFATKVNGFVFSCATAMDALTAVRTRSVMQTSKFRGCLEIGPDCRDKINVYSYGKTQPMSLPSLSKLSIVAEQSRAKDSCEVRREQIFTNPAIESKEVPPENRVRGHRYGKQLIPFSAEMMQACKYETERHIKVLGFMPSNAINRHECMENVDVIVAEPHDNASAVAVSALARALLEMDQVAIVRYVKRKNAEPDLGFLTPMVKTSVEGFYFNKLPFQEDIREYAFGSFKRVPSFQPSKEQLQVAATLIQQMDLMHSQKGDENDDEGTEALKPKYTYNPSLQRFYKSLEQRALNPKAKVASLDPMFARYLYPNPTLLQNAEKTLGQFQTLFELTKVNADETKTSHKRHWRDYFDTEVAGDGAGRIASLSSSFDKTIERESKQNKEQHLSVSTADPIGDLKAMMDLAKSGKSSERGLCTRALRETAKAIDDLVRESFGDSWFDKAKETLLALRNASIDSFEFETYNSTLVSLREKYSTSATKIGFWKRIESSPVLFRPISSNEVSDSTYSQLDSDNFFKTGGNVSSIEVEKKEEVAKEEDDIFSALD